MEKQDCFLLGTIFKLHGYKGDVNIYNDNDIPLVFTDIEFFYIEENNELIPYFAESVRPKKKQVLLVKLEDVNSEEEAKRILKRKVFLPKELLPEIDTNDISEKQLIGFLVVDIKMGELGKIAFINSQTAQQLIYVSKNGKEFCFPWHEKFVRNIDAEKGIMEVEIPQEFLNLN